MIDNLFNSLLKKDTVQEQCTDEAVLALRSEPVKKVDCAITVLNTSEPIIKTLKLNTFIFVTAMLAFMILDLVGLFICLVGAALNLYYFKNQISNVVAIQEKYKIR